MHPAGRVFLFTLLASFAVLAGGMPPKTPSALASTAEVAPPQPPEITGRGAVLMDAESGQVLFEKNGRLRLYPASTTKILTAVIALERGRPDERVTVSPRAWDVDGTSAFLEVGEQLTLEQLLYGLMLPSGNDAAVAIAEHIAGSPERFAELMNEKARALGALDSHFMNPHGLHDPQHYTSARDLALVARYALRNPILARIVATREYSLPAARPGLQPRKYLNHNRLLATYEGANGLKTGFTPEAAHTLVASATRDGRTLIAVTLASDQQGKWIDAARMLDFGFLAFQPEHLVVRGQPVAAVAVGGGEEDLVPVVAAQSVSALVSRPGAPRTGLSFTPADVERRLRMPDRVHAPIDAGAKLGEMDLVVGGRLLAKVDLIAARSVPAAGISGAWRRVQRLAAPIGAAARRYARAAGGGWFWTLAGTYAVWRTGVAIRRYRRKLRRRTARLAAGGLPLYRSAQRHYGD